MARFQFLKVRWTVLLFGLLMGGGLIFGGIFQGFAGKSSNEMATQAAVQGDSKPTDVADDYQKGGDYLKQAPPIPYKSSAAMSEINVDWPCINHPQSPPPFITCHPAYENRVGCDGGGASKMCDTVPSGSGTTCKCKTIP